MSAKLLVQADRPTAAPRPRTRQLIVPIGSWRHPEYGEVDITPERIERMAQHFRAGVKLQDGRLPFTIDHDDGLGAGGWIVDVEPTSDGLMAEVEWTRKGVEAITEDEYPFVSPDIARLYEDPATGERYQDVLESASLVVRPFFKNLPRVEIERYCDEPDPLVMYLDPEELMDNEQIAEDPQAETSGPDTSPEQTDTTAAPPGAVSLQQFSERLASLESENATLRFAERRRQFSDELDSLSFGESSGRRLAPVSRDALADALASLPPDQAAAVITAVRAMRFFEPGERGLADTAETVTQRFSEADAAVAAQFGLSEEEWR